MRWRRRESGWPERSQNAFCMQPNQDNPVSWLPGRETGKLNMGGGPVRRPGHNIILLVCRNLIVQAQPVVARSPDRATPPPEGLLLIPRDESNPSTGLYLPASASPPTEGLLLIPRGESNPSPDLYVPIFASSRRCPPEGNRVPGRAEIACAKVRRRNRRACRPC